MNSFEWTSPRSATEAAGATTTTVASAMVSLSGRPATDGSIFKAGGIDLLDLMKEGLLAPRRIVNLRDVPGLSSISETKDGLRIGANATLAQIAVDPLVRQRYSALAEAAGVSASPQIRHVATLAGNLLQRPRCWYFRSAAHHCARKGGNVCFAFGGDNRHHAIFNHTGCAIVHPSTSGTALVAFDAQLELAGVGGKTRVVKLEDFFLLPEADLHHENDLKPGELVTAVLLPALSPTLSSIHIKQGETDSFDWPLADVAVALDVGPDGMCRAASVVLGGAAPVPHRATATEQALTGKPITEDNARMAARAALQGATPLTMNAYKLPILETLVRRAILSAARTN